MKTKPTPGPWKVDGKYSVSGADGRRVVDCLLYRNIFEGEANARLIARTPDLLDALADCFDELVFLTNSYQLEEADPAVVNRAGELLEHLLTDEQREKRGNKINT